jgi:predicted permease
MLSQDVRYAWRTMRQNATLTATIVVTLGLGIGANTAVFSVVNTIALKTPLSVPAGDQLYTVNSGRYVTSGPESARFSGPTFEEFRRSAPRDVGVAAMSRGITRAYTRKAGDRETTQASLQIVSTNFFPVLGVSPALGTSFTADAAGGAETNDAVAVLSYSFWQRHFAGSPAVIGSTLTINNAPFTVAGVGPRDFSGVWLDTPVDIWIPLAQQSAVKYSQSYSADGAALAKPWLPQSRVWWLHVIVRAPRDAVARAIGTFNASLATNPGSQTQVILEPFGYGFSRIRQQFSTPLVALMVMASLVLLIACANVANVLLARAVGREREIAVRVAIGAGRGRLFRQLFTESALLVVFAATTAVLFASWAGDALVALATAGAEGPTPFLAVVDLRVVAFAAGIALLSVMVFGMWPAWRATRVDVVSALKSNARGAIGRAARPARVLVMTQIALSLVLVTATGLFVRSFQHLLDVGVGFEPDRLVTVTIDPRLSGVPASEMAAMSLRVLDAVTSMPGVESAALAMCGLQGPCARDDGFAIEGYQPRTGEHVLVSVNAITPAYTSTLGMRLLAGRALTDADREGTARVALVNKTLATRYFSDAGDWRAAIGRRIGSGTPDTEIVGVVDDIRALGSLKATTLPSVFVPLLQRGLGARALEVRTSIDPTVALAGIRRAITTAAPDLPIESLETVAARVDRGLSQDRLVVFLTSSFSLLAIGLAGFGLFGVLSYAVARQTPELGLRLALGASPSRVLWGVVRDSLWLVGGGVLLGLPLVVLGLRLVPALIFGVSPYDAVSLLGALILLLTIGAACAIVPALRAAKVDPVLALRSE